MNRQGKGRDRAALRLAHVRDLLHELLARDLKIRYQRSILGIGWSLIRPLAQLLIFLFLFGQIVPLGIEYYATFLFTGVLAWSWFSNAALAAATAITGSPELVRRPGFPAAILPVLTVASEAIHFLLALPILLLLAWWETDGFGIALIALPLIFVIQFAFTLGVAYIVAAIHVSFRDTQNAVGIALMLGFYLTPVFYRPEHLMDSYAFITALNPMAQLLAAYRTVLIDHAFPNTESLAAVAAMSGLLLLAGWWLFGRLRESFVEEL